MALCSRRHSPPDGGTLLSTAALSTTTFSDSNLSLHLHASESARSLNLNDEEIYSDEDEEEEVRMRADSALAMAFREDESRRNAPLMVENASTVGEAMDGIFLAGFSTYWMNHRPEEQVDPSDPTIAPFPSFCCLGI